MMIQFDKTPEQLAKEDIARQALEAAAQKLESHQTNNLYRRALTIGAKLIRDMAMKL